MVHAFPQQRSNYAASPHLCGLLRDDHVSVMIQMYIYIRYRMRIVSHCSKSRHHWQPTFRWLPGEVWRRLNVVKAASLTHQRPQLDRRQSADTQAADIPRARLIICAYTIAVLAVHSTHTDTHGDGKYTLNWIQGLGSWGSWVLSVAVDMPNPLAQTSSQPFIGRLTHVQTLYIITN